MNIGVFGPNGKLGSELVQQGCIPLECDILNIEELIDTLNSTPVDLLINCAAYTDVDGAESEEGYKEAIKINVRGLSYIRRIVFTGLKVPVIHISSDYVFSGKNGPYGENVKPYMPVNKYGWSKYGSEVEFLNPVMAGDVLVRTTGLYGSIRYDFYDLVVEWLMTETEPLLITNELYGNQTYIPHLAEALIHLAKMPTEDRPTVLNLASNDIVTRYEFAKMIAEINGMDADLIKPCKNRDVPGWIANRPTRGGLKVSLAKKLGIPIYTIKQGLEDMKKTISLDEVMNEL